MKTCSICGKQYEELIGSLPKTLLKKIENLGALAFNKKKADFLQWLGWEYGVEELSQIIDEQTANTIISALNLKIKENNAKKA